MKPMESYPWMWSATKEALGPYFLDHHEHTMRLVNGLKPERQKQIDVIKKLFS